MADDTTIEKLKAMRTTPRGYPVVKLPVYDCDNPEVEGYVQDISEKGIQISGMSLKPNAKKTLVVQADQIWDIKPFSFDAECKWIQPGDEDEPQLSGLEIIAISDKDFEELEKVIKMFSLTDINDPAYRSGLS
jgi:methyl coenzyme M reductase gamma subunit